MHAQIEIHVYKGLSKRSWTTVDKNEYELLYFENLRVCKSSLKNTNWGLFYIKSIDAISNGIRHARISTDDAKLVFSKEAIVSEMYIFDSSLQTTFL